MAVCSRLDVQSTVSLRACHILQGRGERGEATSICLGLAGKTASGAKATLATDSLVELVDLEGRGHTDLLENELGNAVANSD